MNSPSALDIQHHLYLSFLESRTCDVALRIRGSWHAVYRLHRVVLIQSGFFRSLFTAGFSEASPRPGRHSNVPEEIDIFFDDTNITRAAFEICIARLYGGGPPLHIPPSLIPTASQPLTPSFPLSSAAFPTETPSGHHLATPRFLLSLLATSIYLSIPALASQALSSILKTLGPYTVLQYLDFSLGRPVGPLDPSLGEPEAAVGLEAVARLIKDDDAPAKSLSTTLESKSEDEFLDMTKEDPTVQDCLSPASSDGSSLSCDDDGGHDTHSKVDPGRLEPSFHYGAISDRIGEAASSWLARWGRDILAYEDNPELGRYDLGGASRRRRAQTLPSSDATRPGILDSERPHIPVIWRRGGLSAQWVRALVSSDSLFVKGERERYNFARSVVELRRKEGVQASEEKEWNEMFERGIYYINMSTEDVMSIAQDVSPTTKRPFVSISILQAAHWSNSVLRHHITSRPSAPAPSSPTAASSSSAPSDKELGFTRTTNDIVTHLSSLDTPEGETIFGEQSKPYYLVSGDSSTRIGDNDMGSGFPSDISMDDLFRSSQPPSLLHSSTASTLASPGTPLNSATKPNSPRMITTESTFFGLLPHEYLASTCGKSDLTGNSRWSPYPPLRFAVEFWDVDSLKEKQRLHSHTIWYGGSLFNVYIQLVKKKGQSQLGIYVHRQSTIDTIPSSSSPSILATRRETESAVMSSGEAARPLLLTSPHHSRGPSLPNVNRLPSPAIPSSPPTPSNLHWQASSPNHYSPSIHPLTRSTTPTSRPQTSSSLPSSSSLPNSTSGFSSGTLISHTLPSTMPGVSPEQPYRDPRSSISAYFSIYCASPSGNSQTRFSSSPDVFKVSQSWGWKSSSLLREGEGGAASEVRASEGMSAGREVSLRATVVLGLI